jgi:cytoskeletal protein CcmA (bactofilin family)
MQPRKPSKILLNGTIAEPFARSTCEPGLPSDKSQRSLRETETEASLSPIVEVDAPPRHYAPGHEVLIGAGVEFKGNIRNCERLVISGSVEGTLVASEVLIHSNATLNAAVVADRVDVFGTVSGRIIAVESVRFREGATFDGRLVYGKMIVETGATLTGDFSKSLDADEQQAVESLAAFQTAKHSVPIEPQLPTLLNGKHTIDQFLRT